MSVGGSGGLGSLFDPLALFCVAAAVSRSLLSPVSGAKCGEEGERSGRGTVGRPPWRCHSSRLHSHFLAELASAANLRQLAMRAALLLLLRRECSKQDGHWLGALASLRSRCGTVPRLCMAEESGRLDTCLRCHGDFPVWVRAARPRPGSAGSPRNTETSREKKNSGGSDLSKPRLRGELACASTCGSTVTYRTQC